jgi:hypothetical protein
MERIGRLNTQQQESRPIHLWRMRRRVLAMLIVATVMRPVTKVTAVKLVIGYSQI